MPWSVKGAPSKGMRRRRRCLPSVFRGGSPSGVSSSAGDTGPTVPVTPQISGLGTSTVVRCREGQVASRAAAAHGHIPRPTRPLQRRIRDPVGHQESGARPPAVPASRFSCAEAEAAITWSGLARFPGQLGLQQRNSLPSDRSQGAAAFCQSGKGARRQRCDMGAATNYCTSLHATSMGGMGRVNFGDPRLRHAGELGKERGGSGACPFACPRACHAAHSR